MGTAKVIQVVRVMILSWWRMETTSRLYTAMVETIKSLAALAPFQLKDCSEEQVTIKFGCLIQIFKSSIPVRVRIRVSAEKAMTGYTDLQQSNSFSAKRVMITLLPTEEMM